MIPHPPSSQQLEFLGLTCEEALYGGAAGGGKSDAGLMGALQYVHVPGYSAGLFRRTNVDLLMPDALLDRANTWFRPAVEAGKAWFDADAHTYHFETKPGAADATIHFGYVQYERDLLRYQGSRFHYVFVDELGQWPEKYYRFLFSRIRRKKSEAVPLRMRSGSNPGGPGHSWIKARFIEHATHIHQGTDVREDMRRRFSSRAAMPIPRVYASPPSKESEELAKAMGLEAQGAFFVPAFSDDNPGLDVASYRAQLARMMPTEREWYEKGNWDAAASGEYFTASSFEYVDQEPAGVLWIRSWDFAATELKPGKDPDWSVGARCGFLFPVVEGKRVNAPRFVVANIKRFRKEPAGTQTEVVQTAKSDGRRTRILMEQEGGSAGKTVIHNWQTQSLVGFIVEGMRKTGPKSEYWMPLARFAAKQPIVLVRGSWNQEFTDELTSLPAGHDDQADAVSQVFAWMSGGGDALARARALAGVE